MTGFYDKVVNALAQLAVLLLLAIMIGIGLDVAARYLINQPIGWMQEYVQHSLLYILFLGMPWLTREGGHVSIDMLVDALPMAGRRVLIAAGLLAAGFAAGFIAFWATVSTVDNFQRGVETNGIYPIPRTWLIGVMALGLALTAVEFFRRSYKFFGASDADILRRHGDLGAEP